MSFNVAVLQERILAAHASGDQERLRALQAEYRRTADLISSERGVPLGTVTLTGGVRTSTSASRRCQTWGNRGYCPEHGYRCPTPPTQSWPALRITKYAEQALRDLAWDGAESSYWLAGQRDGDDLVVERVLGPAGDDWDRSSRHCTIDPARALDLRDQGWDLVGDVHLHPPGSHGRASTPDVRGWQGMLKHLGRDVWAGIIVYERETPNVTYDDRGRLRSWFDAAISGYVVRGANYRPVSIERY